MIVLSLVVASVQGSYVCVFFSFAFQNLKASSVIGAIWFSDFDGCSQSRQFQVSAIGVAIAKMDDTTKIESGKIYEGSK